MEKYMVTVPAAFMHVRDNIEQLGKVAADDTDLLFLKGLLDSPVVNSLVKVLDFLQFNIYRRYIENKMSDENGENVCAGVVRRIIDKHACCCGNPRYSAAHEILPIHHFRYKITKIRIFKFFPKFP